MTYFNRPILAIAAVLSLALLPMKSAQAQQLLSSPVITTPGVSVILQRGDRIVSQDNRFHFVFQYDGNLVLYQGSTALWATGTTPKYHTVTLPGNSPLPVTFMLHACQVAFQADGNLVVYAGSGVVGAVIHPCQNPNNTPQNMSAVWSSETYHYPGSTLHVQDDGNVVIYDTSNRARWSTRTCCR